jgi:c-type cytochrome biogenesis protein CcmF
MTGIGEFGTWLGTVLAMGAFLTSIVALRSPGNRIRNLVVFLNVLVMVELAFLFVYLLYLFAVNDVDYLYVWSRSSSDLDIFYRLGAAWSGAGGSVLLCTLLMASLSYILHSGMMRREDVSSAFLDRYVVLSSMVIAGLMVVILLSEPFAPTIASPDDAWRLISFPDGRGLPLSLQTWEMVVHPLVVFAAYAICFLAFASAGAGLLTKEERWFGPSLRSMRLAWLLLTLGIAIGAWWAYYEVGWGGYWSWDPVETSSLILWVVITAYLHSVARSERSGSYPILSPALGMLTFATVLFTIFVTRSGKLWLFAVHTYASAEGGDAGDRLLTLLANDASVLATFLLLLLVLFLSVYLPWSRWHGLRKTATGGRDLIIDDASTMTATLVTLGTIAIVLVLLLMKNVDSDLVQNYDEFTQKVPLIFSILMLIMIICLTWRPLGRYRAMALTGAVLFVSVFAALFAYVSGMDAFAVFPIPIFIVSGAIAVVRIVQASSLRPAGRALVSISPQLIHLGVALILIAYVCSTSFQTMPEGGNPSPVIIGGSLMVDGYEVRLVDVELTNATPEPSHNYNQVWEVTLDVFAGKKELAKDVHLTNYYLDNGTEVRKVRGEVAVIKTLLDDLYLEFDLGNADQVELSATVIPLMNVLWLGTLLMVVGIACRAFYPWRSDPSRGAG